jgi:hypothetical protein
MEDQRSTVGKHLKSNYAHAGPHLKKLAETFRLPDELQYASFGSGGSREINKLLAKLKCSSGDIR